MLFCIRRCVWMVAAISMLVAGCRAPHRKAVAGTEGAGRGAKQEESSDADMDDLAEAHAHFGTAVIHELNEQPDEALKEYTEAAFKDPGNDELVIDVSRRLVRAGQPEKALELLNRATARPDASGELYGWLGIVHARLGHLDSAIKADRVAIKRQADSLSGYQNLFVTYLQNQKQQEAFNVLEEAGKVPHADPEFLIGLGELYLRASSQIPSQKETARANATEIFQRARKLSLDDPQLRLRLADGLAEVGERGAAAEIYQSLLKDLDDSPFIREGIRAKLIDIYVRDNNSKAAEEQLQAILRDNPTDPQVYELLGDIAYTAKSYEKAAGYFSKAVLLSPDTQESYFDLARAQMAANKNSDALETLDKVRTKFPQSFALEFLSGLIYGQQKDYSNSVAHLTTAEVIARSTNTNLLTDVYFQLGAASERQGKYADAETYFDKCLKISPDDAEALNYLGYMWAERGQNLERARAFIERALKNDPDNAAYLDSMAWVLFKLNQPRPALDYILKAIKSSEGEDATIYDHLGDIYARLGQTDKARDAWKKSVSLEANVEVQKKLESPAK